jgi:hypothetical protein
MRGPDGKPGMVSYDHVLDQIHKGASFVNRTGQGSLSTFAADHAADPQNAENRSDATIKAMASWNPLKYVASIGAGVQDVLEGLGGEAAKTLTAFDKPATSRGETSLQLAAETGAQNFNQGVGALGEQVGELGAAPEANVAKLGKIAELPKLAKTGIKVAEQGLRAATEQGTQAYVKSSGDTGQAASAAEWGGPLGAVSAFTGPVFKKVGNFGYEVEKFFNRVSDIDTGKLVRETAKANEKIAQEAALVRAENATRVADAEKAYKEKVATAKAKYDDAVAGRKSAEEKAQLKQQHTEEQSHIDHDHEVEKARLAHEKVLADQQALEAQKGVARRTELETRGRLAMRMRTIQDAAKAFFNKNYTEIEEAVDGPEDKPSGRAAPWEEMARVVEEALPKIEGSDKSVKPFKDILEKAERFSADEESPPTAAQDLIDHTGYTKAAWSTRTPEEKAEIWKGIKEAWGPEQNGANFKTLRGYYSEAGKLLANESTPPDVKQALVKFREGIEDLQQGMAKDAGVGQRYKLLRSQYKNYAEGFLDYHGTKGEASAVAKAVRKGDAFNATKDFPKMQPEEISNVKQILAGSPADASTQFVEGDIVTPGGKEEPAASYRRDSTKLVDNYVAANREAEKLEAKATRAKPVGEFVPPEYKPPKPLVPKDQKPIGEFKPPEYKEPKLPKEPQPTVMTPEKLKEAKQDALNKMSTIVGRFGIYMAAGGLVGGVYQLIKTGDPFKAASGAGEGVAVGFAGGAVAPYLMARLIDRDDVIQALSKVTHQDLVRLAKMPFKERAEISESLKQLAEEAEAKGKLSKPSPWLRILGGTVARKAVETGKANSQTPETELEDLDKLNSELDTPTTQGAQP